MSTWRRLASHNSVTRSSSSRFSPVTLSTASTTARISSGQDAGLQRESAHTVAVEREREVVLARARRVERLAVEGHVLGGEPVRDGTLLLE
jgi:hypothetical protein